MAPAPTPFDLRWTMFGVPCRVTPWFWLIALIFGYYGGAYLIPAGETPFGMRLAIWVGCTFLSILVHEFGHIIAGRLSGQPGIIVLHGMGGVAVGNYGLLTRTQRALLAAAGPCAGFLLLGLVLFLDTNFWNNWSTLVFHLPPSFNLPPGLLDRLGVSMHAGWYPSFGRFVFADLVIMNLTWNLLNLIPVFPLDGSRILMEICGGLVRGGERIALGISFVLAGLVALYSGLKLSRPDLPYPPFDPVFMIIMFFMLAMQSFTAMRQLEAAYRHFGPPDDH